MAASPSGRRRYGTWMVLMRTLSLLVNLLNPLYIKKKNFSSEVTVLCLKLLESKVIYLVTFSMISWKSTLRFFYFSFSNTECIEKYCKGHNIICVAFLTLPWFMFQQDFLFLKPNLAKAEKLQTIVSMSQALTPEIARHKTTKDLSMEHNQKQGLEQHVSFTF